MATNIKFDYFVGYNFWIYQHIILTQNTTTTYQCQTKETPRGMWRNVVSAPITQLKKK